MVGHEPAPDSCLEREMAQLDACSARLTTPGRGSDRRSRRTAADRQRHPLSEPRLDRRPCPGVHAGVAAAVVLAVPDQNRAATLITVGLGQRERLVDPQPGAPQHDDQGTQAMPVTITPRLGA
jgi:hypothetical protein